MASFSFCAKPGKLEVAIKTVVRKTKNLNSRTLFKQFWD